MSTNLVTNATDTADDLWLVRLRSGKVRAMTLDELDAAFNAGVINALTPILPPNAKEWSRLGIVAGLDDHGHEGTLVGHQETLILPSSRPRPQKFLALAPVTTPRPQVAAPAPVPVASVVTRRKVSARVAIAKGITGRTFAALAVAVLVLSFGISYAARVALGRTSGELETSSLRAAVVSTPAKEASAVSPPSAPAAAAEAHPGSPDVVSGRDAQIRKESPARARRPHVHVRRGAGRAPLLNGGDKYDPLNGAL